MGNESVVQEWNELYPPGTKVELTNDDGEAEETWTRSIAWLLGSGSPVVAVYGRAGGYLLERIKPVEVMTLDKAAKQLKDIEVSLNRVINQVRRSCIEVERKKCMVEELNEMAFDIHHLTPVQK